MSSPGRLIMPSVWGIWILTLLAWCLWFHSQMLSQMENPQSWNNNSFLKTEMGYVQFWCILYSSNYYKYLFSWVMQWGIYANLEGNYISGWKCIKMHICSPSKYQSLINIAEKFLRSKMSWWIWKYIICSNATLYHGIGNWFVSQKPRSPGNALNLNTCKATHLKTHLVCNLVSSKDEYHLSLFCNFCNFCCFL